jgi:hypothetical protein
MDFLHHCASEMGLPARREWAMKHGSFGSLDGLLCAGEGSQAHRLVARFHYFLPWSLKEQSLNPVFCVFDDNT